MQANLFQRAKDFQVRNTTEINSEKEFYEFFKKDGGFALAHWNGDAAIEAKIKADLNVTIRCLPLDKKDAGKCIFSGEDSQQRAVFAKSY